MAHLQTARSFLFAPGSDARKLGRALACGADAVIADLEDAVVPAERRSPPARSPSGRSSKRRRRRFASFG